MAYSSTSRQSFDPLTSQIEDIAYEKLFFHRKSIHIISECSIAFKMIII